MARTKKIEIPTDDPDVVIEAEESGDEVTVTGVRTVIRHDLNKASSGVMGIASGAPSDEVRVRFWI